VQIVLRATPLGSGGSSSAAFLFGWSLGFRGGIPAIGGDGGCLLAVAAGQDGCLPREGDGCTYH